MHRKRPSVFASPAASITACLLFLAPTATGQTGATGQPRRQTIDQQLNALGLDKVAAAAKEKGDAQRGAVVFYQKSLACTRCHTSTEGDNPLGPDLATLGKDVTDHHLIESILSPSKVIRKGFETVMLEVGKEEETVTGLLVSKSDAEVVIRDSGQDYKQVRYPRKDVKSIDTVPVSLMPPGMTNQLHSTQQFFDLVRYLMEIRDGGSIRADELAPPPSLYADLPLPAYENDLDHAGLIKSLDRQAFNRGKQIYGRLCVNCHGTHEEPGSLPTSLRFASGKFKNGHDPFSMYQTLTKGFGMMIAQTWMVPSQKYDVIHYIREAYLERDNPSQYSKVDDAYLAQLPKGNGRGPAPSNITAWEQMDYGPNQIMTLEIGEKATNFAYKGNVVRLDAGPGGVAQGRYWMVFDTDTMRVAAAWSGKGMIDWNSIHFNGKHAIHPRLAGEVHLANPTGPGWGRPSDGSFEDVRLVGRDDRIYGPLPREWSHYKGMYYHGPNTIFEYTVGTTRILETPGVQPGAQPDDTPVFTRSFDIGPRNRDLVLQVANSGNAAPKLLVDAKHNTAMFGDIKEGQPSTPNITTASIPDASKLNGGTKLEVSNLEGLNTSDGDFTVTARIKTERDGTILAHTKNSPQWTANGLTWFIRGGRLAVDIGWVGVHQGQRRVANGKWQDVAFSYEGESGEIRFYVNGRPEKRVGNLQRKGNVDNPVVRIGYTADDFPSPSFFNGQIAEVRFFNEVLGPEQIQELRGGRRRGKRKNPNPISKETLASLAAHWDLAKTKNTATVTDTTKNRHDALVTAGAAASESSGQSNGLTVAGYVGETAGFEWQAAGSNLRLVIPAGKNQRRFTLWFASAEDKQAAEASRSRVTIDTPSRSLEPLTKGGPARWNQILTTQVLLGKDDGPFAVDVLKRPKDNPWFCRMRLTGFDFTRDGDVAYVSAWDGSIWKVSGLNALPATSADSDQKSLTVQWRRIASGLYQPLGVKIVDGQVYVTCRDQLCILHDLNGDEEIDYFEAFNSDHQVTDHFHEFAMGLQTDDAGNFYYAKSARHAKTALVPHHGTLLKVSKDGQKTEIIANGFRAANGVCINPDGTFIVTDQEGHWNPKNRINYVEKGGFYGNMYGYHDVTDTADSAMEQPLCWITNSFDRSPGELLWVDSEKWGPLNKRLLNLSYGYGMVYIVPHEKIDGQAQGGMCAFPIKRFPTGVMRGRFHDGDGQLYLAGMFAWAGSQHQPGGLYRLRYTGKPVHLPVELSATKKGMKLVFSGKLSADSATKTGNYQVKMWNLKRTKSYGSKHYDERKIEVSSARLSEDSKTVFLELPDIAKTWCMEIRYTLKSAQGKTVRGNIHNTIHKLN